MPEYDYFNGENVISLEQEKIFIYDNSAQIKRIGIYKIKKQR